MCFTDGVGWRRSHPTPFLVLCTLTMSSLQPQGMPAASLMSTSQSASSPSELEVLEMMRFASPKNPCMKSHREDSGMEKSISRSKETAMRGSSLLAPTHHLGLLHVGVLSVAHHVGKLKRCEAHPLQGLDSEKEVAPRFPDNKYVANIPQECNDNIVNVQSTGKGMGRNLIHPTPSIKHMFLCTIVIQLS